MSKSENSYFESRPRVPRKEEEVQQYTSTAVQQRECVQICPCGTSEDRIIHLTAECKPDREERETLVEEMRKIDGCDAVKFWYYILGR